MKFLSGALLIYAFAGSTVAAAPTADPLAADRELAKQFGAELKSTLIAALQDSPENAIAICNERAPRIAQSISTKHDALIGRTALRVRNPDNAPSDWQRTVLEQFQQRHKAGEPLAVIEYAATIEADGMLEHRYMKAIPTEPLCVACHGDYLTPGLKSAIASKYPQDAATGFEIGELRGAFYVVRREPREASSQH